MSLLPYLTRIAEGGVLSSDEAAEAMDVLLRGEGSVEQMAGLLMGLRSRGETLDELVGLTLAMRKHSVPVAVPVPNAIDIVGTGGDRSGSFNISTATFIVCAGAGATVAKHGSRSVSSKSGSADVLESLGVKVNLQGPGVEACLREAGLGFMFAPWFHPALRHAMPVRKALGVRTVFNILGPMCSPAGIRRGLYGAFSTEVAETTAEILSRLGSEHILAVHSDDGLDEISISSPTTVFERASEAPITVRKVRPEDFGLDSAPPDAVKGGLADENARIIRDILAGKKGPCRDVVVLNAGFALVAGELASDPSEGVLRAQEAIDSGRAAGKLAALVQASNDFRGG